MAISQQSAEALQILDAAARSKKSLSFKTLIALFRNIIEAIQLLEA